MTEEGARKAFGRWSLAETKTASANNACGSSSTFQAGVPGHLQTQASASPAGVACHAFLLFWGDNCQGSFNLQTPTPHGLALDSSGGSWGATHPRNKQRDLTSSTFDLTIGYCDVSGLLNLGLSRSG